MKLLIILILAHLIGDFLLQPYAWVKHKETRRWRSWVLYVHAFIHSLLVAILWWVDWYLLASVFVIHLFIDGLKSQFQTPTTKRQFFFYDQLLHFISLIGLYFIFSDHDLSAPLAWLTEEQNLLFLTCILFLSVPASVLTRTFISKWTPQDKANNEGDSTDDSLDSAGRTIGILERWLVFVFIILNQWAAVGFLLAAKSIFRFGDLRGEGDRSLTEYVLIGTLVSFGTSIIVGVLYTQLV